MKTHLEIDNQQVTVNYGLLLLKGNSHPYFHIRAYSKVEQSGDLLDKVLEKMPELQCLVPLHLASSDGTPTYAVENGLYFLGFTKYQEFNLTQVMKHFRINEQEALELHAKLRNIYKAYTGGAKIATDKTKEWLQGWVEQRKPIWLAEAQHAIKSLNLTVEYK